MLPSLARQHCHQLPPYPRRALLGAVLAAENAAMPAQSAQTLQICIAGFAAPVRMPIERDGGRVLVRGNGTIGGAGDCCG